MTELLKKVADGIVSPEEAALKLKMQPFMEIGEFAKVDVHCGIRQGVPEVIYGECDRESIFCPSRGRCWKTDRRPRS